MYLSELEFSDPHLTLSTRSGALAALVLEAFKEHEMITELSEPRRSSHYPVLSLPAPLPESERLCLRYFGE